MAAAAVLGTGHGQAVTKSQLVAGLHGPGGFQRGGIGLPRRPGLIAANGRARIALRVGNLKEHEDRDLSVIRTNFIMFLCGTLHQVAEHLTIADYQSGHLARFLVAEADPPPLTEDAFDVCIRFGEPPDARVIAAEDAEGDDGARLQSLLGLIGRRDGDRTIVRIGG